MKTQNSGVMVEDEEVQYANGLPVVLFDCVWFNTDPTNRGRTKRDYGLLSMDTSTSWYEVWPYWLATISSQVFYLDDLKTGDNWKVVNVVSHRGTYSQRSLARQDNHDSTSSGQHTSVTLISPQEDDPYQECMPSHIINDVQHATINPNMEQIPRARRQLNLDEEEDDEETTMEDEDEHWDETMEVEDDQENDEIQYSSYDEM
ncbi:unnamed protein product [Rhodiola kirilowii]